MEIAVIGSGAMGSGIAQVFLASGVRVTLYDVNESVLNKARERIEKGLRKRGQEAHLKNLKLVTRLEDLEGADMAVEAAPERLEIKQAIFSRLDQILPPPRVLATNTSSIKIEFLAWACANPERVAGMHFFNPVPLMRFVEVISGPATNEETLKTILAQAKRLGKEAVVTQDSPGFLVNRIMVPFGLEALALLETERLRPDVVDEAMRKLGHFRMGPFELMDFIGLDVDLEINRILFHGFHKTPRFRTSETHERLVAVKKLGRKSGEGFYRYNAQGKVGVNAEFESMRLLNENEGEKILIRIMAVVINEAFLVLEEGLAEDWQIDQAFVIGCNWPQGPFGFFQALKPANVLDVMRELNHRNPKRYPIASSLLFRAQRSYTLVK